MIWYVTKENMKYISSQNTHRIWSLFFSPLAKKGGSDARTEYQRWICKSCQIHQIPWHLTRHNLWVTLTYICDLGGHICGKPTHSIVKLLSSHLTHRSCVSHAARPWMSSDTYDLQQFILPFSLIFKNFMLPIHDNSFVLNIFQIR